ncbi:MAG: purine-nucleoside phosphorylase [Clostridiaceae bacterium]|nr:purine-nucleoside phosphorylase [Clostridiaceae bacterium]
MSNESEYRSIEDACQRIRDVFPPGIRSAVVLGSGLSELVEGAPLSECIAYADIPHFMKPTVKGHSGTLSSLKIGNTDTFILQGRYHCYEGYSAHEATFPIRVLSELGVNRLILTNSAGGISKDMKPGDLMLISDHLSFFCDSPLRGPNLDRYGPRFPDQSMVYDPELLNTAVRLAKDLSIPVHVGIYAFMRGPQYETPSEIRALSLLGASAVGMSTVPEAIVASHCGMKVLGLSCISNLASGISDHPLSHEEVIHTAKISASDTIHLIRALFSS